VWPTFIVASAAEGGKMSTTSARVSLRRGLAACTAGVLAAIVAASPLEGQAVAAVGGSAGTTGHASLVSCSSLITLALPHTTVNSATQVPATPTTPGYCAVKLTVNNPPSSDAVRVGVFLPDDWNGRFQGVGGGGFVGGNADSPSLAALNAGYATAGTDTGHAGSGGNGAFALNPDGTLNWPLINDFSYLGIHEMTVTAKAVIAAYYGNQPKYSYFNGCSTGGRQGYMEAQRYPIDYDGIAAGAPAINWDRFMVAQMWGELQMNLAGDFIPQCKFAAANQAAVAACDGLDGVTDGIIGDWRGCTFDARSLIGTVTACGPITAVDADIINKIWTGPSDPQGNFLWYGLLPGASFAGLNLTLTSGGVTTPAPFVISLNHFIYWLARDTNFDWRTMTYVQFVQFFEQSVSEFNSVIGTSNPDLSAFRHAGGKIVGWVGTYDQLIYPEGSIDYYRQVIAEQGGLKKTGKFFRFFIAPGVAHCGGGVGAAPADPFGALVDWVEHHKAPNELLGVRRDSSGAVVMTRPVCPYGKNAVYKGHGDTNDKKSFSCKPYAAGFHSGGP
jgi:Tannase and feruloyl esterase